MTRQAPPGESGGRSITKACLCFTGSCRCGCACRPAPENRHLWNIPGKVRKSLVLGTSYSVFNRGGCQLMQCPLWVRSGPLTHPPDTSAFRGEADGNQRPPERPLIATSGHSTANKPTRKQPPRRTAVERANIDRLLCSCALPSPAHQSQPGEGREEQRERSGKGDGRRCCKYP